MNKNDYETHSITTHNAADLLIVNITNRSLIRKIMNAKNRESCESDPFIMCSLSWTMDPLLYG